MLQCYYNENKVDENGNSLRCKNQQEDPWCSSDHKKEIQQERYGRTPERKIKRTIQEIQNRLAEMKKRA